MSHKPDVEHAIAEGNGPPKARKAYESPKILAREPLEAVAAVCTPSPPAKTFGACFAGQRSRNEAMLPAL